ncbi:hypothetical protein EV359DRAFT_64941 [Lentinula novae-zelandiae]|nr:hypothetical protein EV359DRAFT_64941 [Lentinula novae-zelandiae]
MSLLPRLPTTLCLLSCTTCNLNVNCEKAILSRVETLCPHKVQFRKWNTLNFAGNGTTRLWHVAEYRKCIFVESTADVATCEGLIPRLQNLKKLRIIRTAGNIPLPDIINSPKLKVVEIYLFSKLWTRGLHRDLINWLIQPTTWSQLRHLSMRMVSMHYHTATGLLDDPLPWSKLANVLNDQIRFPALQMVEVILIGARKREEGGNDEWDEPNLIFWEETEWIDHEVILGRKKTFERRQHTMNVIFRAMTEGQNQGIVFHVTY